MHYQCLFKLARRSFELPNRFPCSEQSFVRSQRSKMNLGLLTLVVVYCVLFNQKVDSKKTVNRGSQRSIFNRIISERIRAKRAVWNLNSFRNPEELGDYVEGDIIQTISGGLGRSSSQIALWPGGTIPYVISGDFSKYFL